MTSSNDLRHPLDRMWSGSSSTGGDEVTGSAFGTKTGSQRTDVGFAAGSTARASSIIVIDKRHLTLECLASWLAAKFPALNIYAYQSTAEALRQAQDAKLDSGVILLSIGAALASDTEVTESITSVAETFPGVPILLISDREEPAAIMEALALGVRGYIPTSMSFSVMIGAIYLVQSGGTFVPASALSTLNTGTHVQEADPPELSGAFTPRQAQVLKCLRQGKPNKLIAYELNMCESTVKVHVRHIMKKLQATNRTQVAFLTSRLFDGETPP